ncbi:hypothetical protein LEP1GSC125_1176 [Leptospira mayottensis 200901122]|uniref:Uncharacterized protein n=1 Tax=Leptospira mayottensis 200901122 TaxID=1193010 RepID=A0AA87MRT4_9LEPT|nr:hypothetical protein LEP1GSC125_1176 [Leptospira mayottensis 200901122]
MIQIKINPLKWNIPPSSKGNSILRQIGYRRNNGTNFSYNFPS